MSLGLKSLCCPVSSVVNRSVGQSCDAVFEAGDIEVQKQADFLAAQFQIRDQLGFMERDHFFHGFQFDDDCIFNENVDPVADIQFHLVVNQRQTHLAKRSESTFPKLINQTRFVSRFQKSRTKPTVNFDGRGNDFRSERVVGFGSVRVHIALCSTTEPKPRTTEIFKT